MQSKIFWQARSEYGWYEVRWWIANDCRLRASGLPLWAIFLDVNTSQIAQYMEGTEQWKYMVISLEDIKCSTAQGSTAQLQSGRMLVTTIASVARRGIFLKPAPCLLTNPWRSCCYCPECPVQVRRLLDGFTTAQRHRMQSAVLWTVVHWCQLLHCNTCIVQCQLGWVGWVGGTINQSSATSLLCGTAVMGSLF